VVAERADVCLVGNHDLVALDAASVGIEEFNPDAAAAAAWTRAQLAHVPRRFLETLAPTARRADVALFHASARDPVWEYVLDGEAALATLELTSEPAVLVGHSHIALAISLAGDELGGGLAPGGSDFELAGARWLLNPGSVGQPRDGDRRAAWLMLDLETRRAQFRRVEYDVERTQREILAAGLPPSLAERLGNGV
jgi:diadenosine tetraphosphatase ApaH/serine/threonine PP2A family protein phosphatase